MAGNDNRKIVSERPISFAEIDRRAEKAYAPRPRKDQNPDRRESQDYIAPDKRAHLVREMRPQPLIVAPMTSAVNWPQHRPLQDRPMRDPWYGARTHPAGAQVRLAGRTVH